MDETLYSKYCNIEETDMPLIRKFLNEREFEFTPGQSGVSEHEVNDQFFYYIFTDQKQIIDPMMFAYQTRLEPILIFNIKEKSSVVICLKATQKLEHTDVEYILSQMVTNADYFRVPEAAEGLTLDEYICELDGDIVLSDASNQLSAKGRFVTKLLFASGYIYYIKFNLAKVVEVAEAALELAVRMSGKPSHLVTVGELKKIALTDQYFEAVKGL